MGSLGVDVPQEGLVSVGTVVLFVGFQQPALAEPPVGEQPYAFHLKLQRRSGILTRDRGTVDM